MAALTAAMNAFLSKEPACWASIEATFASLACPVRSSDGASAASCASFAFEGGAISELTVGLKRTPNNTLRTDEDTVDLLRRLAVHYPDATIAHILNRQGRRTARGLSFTAGRVQSLRHHHQIPCHTPTDDVPQVGELLTVAD